jgi:HlyD family secretion protein
MAKQIFRQESLEQLSSPEELDQLLVVVNRNSWLILMTLTAICAAVAVWAIVGRIPVRVDGLGVLVNAGNVKGIQSPASGQITSLAVRMGQHVVQGETLALVDQPELRKELDQRRAKRVDTVRFQKAASEADERRKELEFDAFEKQQRFIAAEIEKTGALASRLAERAERFTLEQRRNLDKTQQLILQLNQGIKKQLETLNSLKSEGLSSQDVVLGAETNLADSDIRIADLEVQRHELELSDIEREQAILDQQNRLSDLALRLMQLDIGMQRLAQELMQNQVNREQDLIEQDNVIARLELRLELESRITSDSDGTILEVAVQLGQVVGLGTRVATIAMDDPSAVLTNLGFFSVRDGKRISVGDVARVTPSTVQREREGSILGRVRSVSAFPVTQESVVNDVGNAQIARTLLEQGGTIEVEIELERDANSYSGFRWTSKGPETKFTPGTTSAVRITIEQHAPITYLLPILRAWFLGEKDAREAPM